MDRLCADRYANDDNDSHFMLEFDLRFDYCRCHTCTVGNQNWETTIFTAVLADVE